MANPQHIEWLKEGVEAWNARRERDDFVPDFEGLDFLSALIGKQASPQLNSVELAEINLEDANMAGCSLLGADLAMAKLRRANLRNASFVSCRLTFTDFSDADLSGAGFGYALADHTVFRNANLNGVFISLSWDWSHVDLRGAQLVDTVFPQSNLDAWDVRDTDLRKVKYLDKRYYTGLRGNSRTLLPSRLSTPEEWLSETETPLTTNSDVQIAISTEVTPTVEVNWRNNTLEAQFVLSAHEPAPKKFHPPLSPDASMDLLGSIGQFSRQIETSIRTNETENTAFITGSVADIFSAIHKEVHKPIGMVLSFVIEANIVAIERLSADSREALTDVDQALLGSFLDIANRWRANSGILQEIEDPTHSELVPEEHLDEIEEKSKQLVALLNSEEMQPYVGPSLPGVTVEMSNYPWDKDAYLNRKKKAAAFGAIAAQLVDALKTRPTPELENVSILSSLASLAISILSFFMKG